MLKKLRKFLSTRKTLSIIIDFLGIIILWRGVWGLMDLFLFPGNELLSYIASIGLGFILLFLDGNGLDDLE